MNEKLAKNLRHIAKTVITKDGQSTTDYMETKYTEDNRKRKYYTEYETDEKGDFMLSESGEQQVKEKHIIASGTITIDPKCFRGQYHALKRAVRI